MSNFQKSVRLGQRSIWLLLLCLISGLFAHQAKAQVAPVPPMPDVIVFKNGDQLTGTLVSGVGTSVTFKSDLVGEVTISMDKVKELRSSGSFAVLRKDEKVTRTSKLPGKITFADGNITVAHPGGAPETEPSKDLAFIVNSTTYNKEVTSNPGIWYGWKGSILGAATIIQSTSHGQTLTAGISLIRAIPTVPYLPLRTRTTFNLFETYGKLTQPVIPFTGAEDQVAKTNIFHADAEHDRYFTPRMYGLVGAAFDHNYAQGVNLQQIYGAGLGWTLLQSPVQQFDVKADVHYEMQSFVPPTTSQNLIGSTFGEAYRRTLPAKILFTESGEYIQSWNNFKAYSAVGNVGLAMPVYKRFSLSVSAQDNYLNNPPFGYKKNSLLFVTGISYTLP